MDGQPLYRIQREAAEDAAWGWFVGLFRKLRTAVERLTR